MDRVPPESEQAQRWLRHPGWRTVIGLTLGATILLAPMVLIERGYLAFVREHGGIREGAAGASLALAVMIRAVIRTLMRSLVRTSARASLKVSLRSLFKNLLRQGMRLVVAAGLRRAAVGARTGPDFALKASIYALLAGGLLIVASWIMVIRGGQPYRETNPAQTEAAPPPLHEERVQPGRKANDLRQELERRCLAWRAERDPALRAEAADALAVATAEFLQEYVNANGRLIGDDIQRNRETARELEASLTSWGTPPAFSGEIGWGSPVLWWGGLLFVLPVGLTFAIARALMRRAGGDAALSTGAESGLVQLYFAGAFSFMPLAADLHLQGADDTRGKAVLAGLSACLGVSFACWALWRWAGGNSWLLFTADAFLLYPLVQCFPLRPLDGHAVWKWRRKSWAMLFLVVMVGFLFTASEGLKRVI
jgi:hypothetical protein